ncbi:signal peptidase II [Beijerinckia indica]|uniref:Lipoprotein signal peptidase n=1 Tax=Beijerinckia indica subsp. indica (strain ATCC 9039 / DSM 1715 / NCIMB 8712) TaxID=395963 RepID=LSPA_BEII9|nr:signal peptidase II [Beijerinckia indica]B2II67.1 RecName: Full=Lipoprotein signal peptidase; AltName: Full=Prolipoprotein signal peptidase; AltName: Full=Signal peptidase II; Short=SPase II [Beijerinckia indica subsp. indica ATCC 9039]ACB94650.1 lipoprotein signal peptidase [Beijerinckia indica subsp. indica ATCC 9039]
MSPRVLGGLAAFLCLVLDQANKLWLIHVFDIEARRPVRLAPFFDIIYERNPGISYSLFRAQSAMGRWILVALTLFAILLLSIWLWRATNRLVALALGCIIGGALGNAIDRIAAGAVADFYYFHIGSFSWYVFNLADAAIVAGVALLILDAFTSEEAGVPAPDSEGHS